MASIKIILYKHKKLKNGKHPIVMQIIHKSKIKKISLGYEASIKEWNFTTSRPNRKHPNYKRLFVFIEKKQSEANNIMLKFEDENEDYTIDELMEQIAPKKDNKSFFFYTQSIIEELQKTNKFGNAKAYKTVLNSVIEFSKNKDFHLTKINYKWLKSFENFHLAKGNSINGISVYLRTIRAILNRAIREDIIKHEHYPFYKFKIKKEQTRKRAIEKEDVFKIRDIELIENTPEWHAKNYFLFSFYTRGMSWIDMVNLKKNNISAERISYKRAKTGKLYSIKINEAIQNILDLYINNNSEYIFPIIKRPDNPTDIKKDIENGMKTYNKYLKRLAAKCKIDTKLTGYVARHSWATIAKKMGYSVEIISEGLGHGEIRTTQIYLADFDDNVLDDANDMITS